MLTVAVIIIVISNTILHLETLKQQKVSVIDHQNDAIETLECWKISVIYQQNVITSLHQCTRDKSIRTQSIQADGEGCECRLSLLHIDWTHKVHLCNLCDLIHCQPPLKLSCLSCFDGLLLNKLSILSTVYQFSLFFSVPDLHTFEARLSNLSFPQTSVCLRQASINKTVHLENIEC